MKRKPKRAEASQADRWMLSYSDFITLMFALFVSLYAMSLKDKGGAGRVSASVRRAVQTGGVSGTLESLEPDTTKSPPKAAPSSKFNPLQESFNELQIRLAKEIGKGQVKVAMDSRGLVITLQEKAFFPSGGDDIFPSALGSLQGVAESLARIPNAIRLEGHTDSKPVRGGRFRSNWELSSARATALLDLLHAEFGVEQQRMSVAGFADNNPVASNETEEGRSRNRRVEIVVLQGT